jgi:hypothetical protein
MKSCLTTRSDVRAWFFSAITPLLFVLPRRLVHAPNRIIVTPESTRFTRTFAVLPTAVVYGRPMTSYSVSSMSRSPICSFVGVSP